jgi:PTS system galactitol-specific IIA component
MGAVDTSLFSPDLVFLGVEASSPDELFDKLGAELEKQGCVKPSWYEAIKAREAAYPTGLACPAGPVAVPHTDPEHLVRPYIAVVVPAEPVVFQPMANMGDEVPAEFIVNLGIQHADGQVEALQALMEIFADEAAMADVRAQTTPEGVVEALVSRM